ncbi:hypothetical protein ACE193_23735 [Bernardetia sp. OM2101]|uniref:hypothetical protein n=1 Tax=Bernardetia sp. OM2101 TaxID=3344876 RepID=UPI0035CF72CD
MKEEIYVHSGRGILNIKGSPTESILYVRSKPRIMSFFAEVNTTLRYQIGKEVTEELIRVNHKYENIVNEGNIDLNKSLEEQFQYITELLTNGKYTLSYYMERHETHVQPAISKDSNYISYDTYGGLYDIVATQFHLNQKKVKQYKSIISKGKKPIVLLLMLENSANKYIIDGHHKLKAYKDLKINPKVLVISKLDAKNIKYEEGMKIITSLGVSDKNIIERYKDEKESRFYENNFYNLYSK